MSLSLFTNQFNKLAVQHHRYQVFKDFVVLTFIALNNSIPQLRRNDLEEEAKLIASKYSESEYSGFSELFGALVQLLDNCPRDILGEIYMSLGLGNSSSGQYFTPYTVNKLTCEMMIRDLESKPFVMLSEPSCGSGGLVLAYVERLIKSNINPASKLFVVAKDIDRTTAMMCYIQLALWNVPAQIIVGDTLLNQNADYFYTPAYFLYGWRSKLKGE